MKAKWMVNTSIRLKTMSHRLSVHRNSILRELFKFKQNCSFSLWSSLPLITKRIKVASKIKRFLNIRPSQSCFPLALTKKWLKLHPHLRFPHLLVFCIVFPPWSFITSANYGGLGGLQSTSTLYRKWFWCHFSSLKSVLSKQRCCSAEK